MKILIICSKAFYKDIAPIKEKLEENGHVVELPNSYYEPDAEKKSWDLGEKAHSEFKARMFKMSEERIATMDAVLIKMVRKTILEELLLLKYMKHS